MDRYSSVLKNTEDYTLSYKTNRKNILQQKDRF